MDYQSSEKVVGAELLDKKIEEVARALRATRAFEVGLHESSGHDFVHSLVTELEHRLASLRKNRVSIFAGKATS